MNENAIEFLNGDKRATLSLSQRRYITKVEKLAEKYPDECEIVAHNKDGSICAHVPISWIKISPPRQMSDEQKQACAERLREMNAQSTGQK